MMVKESAALDPRGTASGARLRVTSFVTVFGNGGTERQFMNLTRGLDRRRFDLRFGCLRRWGPYLNEVEQAGIPLETYPIPRFASVTSVRSQLVLAARLRRRQVDVVHAYNFYGNVFAVPAARLARTPVVIASIRDCTATLTPAQRTVQRYVCGFADRIVVNADAIRQYLVSQQYDGRKIVVIRNGIDFAPFRHRTSDGAFRRELGIPDGVPVLGCVARLASVKGLEHLVAAFGRVAAASPARLVIVGDGFVDRNGTISPNDPYLAKLMGLARDCGVSDRVIFTGYRADVPAVLPEFDVLVSASLDEGLSNSILEAMAAGVPVIATRVGGSPEAVVDGETGRLVPPADPGALAAAMTDVLATPTAGHRMGERGRQRAHDLFSVDAMVAKTADLYESLFADRRRRLRKPGPAPTPRQDHWTPRDQRSS
jgi:glycosyltransferase involved in cell wall biosynthesis